LPWRYLQSGRNLLAKAIVYVITRLAIIRLHLVDAVLQEETSSVKKNIGRTLFGKTVVCCYLKDVDLYNHIMSMTLEIIISYE
jgi:hypothetical protein